MIAQPAFLHCPPGWHRPTARKPCVAPNGELPVGYIEVVKTAETVKFVCRTPKGRKPDVFPGARAGGRLAVFTSIYRAGVICRYTHP